MSIRFVCVCGKHLRARDDMAARRTVCPRCGAPVGIPSAGRPDAAEPVPQTDPPPRRRPPVAENLAKDRDDAIVVKDPYEQAPPASGWTLDHALRRLVRTRKAPATTKPRRPGFLETRWSFFWSVRAWWLMAGLTLALTAFTGLATLMWSRIVRDVPDHVSGPGLMFFGLASVVPLLLVSYACCVLDCVLRSAIRGEPLAIGWPGSNAGEAVLSLGRWLLCFCAGPILLLAGAGFYWLYCGDPVLLDWVIVVELCVVGLGWWLYSLLAVIKFKGIRGFHPLRVVRLAKNLGLSALVVVLAATLAIMAIGLWLLAAVATLHVNAATGWGMLLLGYGGGLVASIGMLRLLGVWCHRCRV